MTCIYHIYFFFLYIKPYGFIPCFGFFYRKRKPNVTKPHYSDYNFFTAYFIKQCLFHHRL